MKPWQNVTNIDYQTGPRGGECWVLTLECGHLAFRPIPNMSYARITNYAASGQSIILTAPSKVRCRFCKNVELDMNNE